MIRKMLSLLISTPFDTDAAAFCLSLSERIAAINNHIFGNLHNFIIPIQYQLSDPVISHTLLLLLAEKNPNPRRENQ